MLKNVFDYFLTSDDIDRLVFYYEGPISQQVVVSMGNLLKEQLQMTDKSQTKARRLFSAYVEIMQNIAHYAANNHKGAIMVCGQNDKYFVLSANQINKPNETAIRHYLEQVSNMSLEDIKQAYRELLRHELPDTDGSKGAGLGFYTLALQSSEPIHYAFAPDPENEQQLYFYLKVTF